MLLAEKGKVPPTPPESCFALAGRYQEAGSPLFSVGVDTKCLAWLTTVPLDRFPVRGLSSRCAWCICSFPKLSLIVFRNLSASALLVAAAAPSIANFAVRVGVANICGYR